MEQREEVFYFFIFLDGDLVVAVREDGILQVYSTCVDTSVFVDQRVMKREGSTECTITVHIVQYCAGHNCITKLHNSTATPLSNRPTSHPPRNEHNVA